MRRAAGRFAQPAAGHEKARRRAAGPSPLPRTRREQSPCRAELSSPAGQLPGPKGPLRSHLAQSSDALDQRQRGSLTSRCCRFGQVLGTAAAAARAPAAEPAPDAGPSFGASAAGLCWRRLRFGGPAKPSAGGLIAVTKRTPASGRLNASPTDAPRRAGGPAPLQVVRMRAIGDNAPGICLRRKARGPT